MFIEIMKQITIGLFGIVSSNYKLKEYANSTRKCLDFNQWLVGFIDAEGNFQIVLERDKYIRLLFRIHLHVDDIEVLYRIRDYLGVGHVETRHTTCTFIIRKTQDIISILVPFLKKNKLRTTKYFDFIDFSRVAYLIKDNSSFVKNNIADIIICYNRINTKRISPDISKIPETSINISWLIGFIEGEGTFGFKNLSPYFQIGQHVRNRHVIENISPYLGSLSSLFSYSDYSPSIQISSVLNKRTDVLSISNSNIDSLHDIFVYHFLPYPFQTRKATDFHYWCLVLYMHKFGYYYTSEGRELCVTIANYVNKSRYSNASDTSVVITEPVISSTLFSSNLPVKLIPEMSHLQLSQAFARVREPRLV